MRVVLHTPQVFVEEVELPDLLAGKSDDDLLTSAMRRRRVKQYQLDTGPVFVYSRGAADLETAAKRVSTAKAAATAAVEEARALAVAAMDAGLASERSVAELFGIDRNTVRAWRGKPRSTNAGTL